MKRKKRNFIWLAAAGIFLLAGVVVGFVKGQQSAAYVLLTNATEDAIGYDDYSQAFARKLEQDGQGIKILQLSNKSYTSLQQYQLLQNYVKKGTRCIVVDPATKSNLFELLPEYRKEGIKVISVINEANEQQRDLHVGIADPVKMGKQMMEDVYSLTGEEGHFLVISDSMQGSMSNDLIKGIRGSYEEKSPEHLYMDDILRAPESKGEVLTKFEEYLKKMDRSVVILCLTCEITEIACKAVKNSGLEEDISIIGISDQSNIEKIKALTEGLHMKIYYYDDQKFGQYLAELSQQVTEEKIKCQVGEKIEFSDGTVREITENYNRTADDPEGVEVFLFEDWEVFEQN